MLHYLSIRMVLMQAAVCCFSQHLQNLHAILQWPVSDCGHNGLVVTQITEDLGDVSMDIHVSPRMNVVYIKIPGSYLPKFILLSLNMMWLCLCRHMQSCRHT